MSRCGSGCNSCRNQKFLLVPCCLASELLTQNRSGNPSAPRPLLTPSEHGWYAPGKEGSDGPGDAAPEAPAVGRGQVADLHRSVRQGCQGRRRAAALAHRFVAAGAHPGPGEGRRAGPAQEGARAQSQRPRERSLEGRGVPSRGCLQGSVDREHPAQKKSGWV
jgi:hypothetical protein